VSIESWSGNYLAGVLNGTISEQRVMESPFTPALRFHCPVSLTREVAPEI
jgi:hypothetical protein